jgi:16S rRNA (uracil1498-N3)-methyltransferase
MHIFYAPEISKTNCLPQEESYHAIRVLRLRKNALIHIVDGYGGFYEASIQIEDSSAAGVVILKEHQNYGFRNYNLHIYIGPTKHMDRFEFFIEKAVEIGVDEITPLECEHTERFKLRVDRLEKIIITAMKQSYKAFKPKLNPLTPFSSAIEVRTGINGIAHCASNSKVHIKQFLSQAKINGESNIGIFIGPEGDFSSQEIQAAENKGCIGISLGSSRLRTETAGVIACYAVNSELGSTS